jgi:NAD(P)-dependent dehydrogenase (short-subunit alcohol dehydrogenase family)
MVMKRDAAVITGASSGIGRALTLALARSGVHVVGAARRRDKLEELENETPNIVGVAADLSVLEGRELLRQTLERERLRVRYLVHAIGTVDPVSPLAQISVQAWREAQAVNVEAPLFTTITLLPLFFDRTRILFVGSASSDRPRKGWGAYCCGKSALLMAYRCLREEWEKERIAICSAKPGPVNTAIFEKGSQADREIFPDGDLFDELKKSGQVASPDTVALFLKWLLLECPREEFGQREWDIRERSHHPFWLQGELYPDVGDGTR